MLCICNPFVPAQEHFIIDDVDAMSAAWRVTRSMSIAKKTTVVSAYTAYTMVGRWAPLTFTE